MAKSIAKAILKNTRGVTGPGKHIKGSFPVKYRKSGNQRSFGSQRIGVRGGANGTINTGGNSGPVGYE